MQIVKGGLLKGAGALFGGWLGGKSASTPTRSTRPELVIPELAFPLGAPERASTPKPPPEPTPFPTPARFQRPKKADRRDETWLNRRGGESDAPLARVVMHEQVEGFLAYLRELEAAGEIDLSGAEITRGKIWRGAFSDVLAPLYIEFCFEYWMEAYRWDGTNGFAQRLRQRTDARRAKKLYAYTQRQGEEARLVFFRLLDPLPATPKWFVNRAAQLAASNVVDLQPRRAA